eukprot:1145562-Pelagomonas_calceolata.AAC.4
MVKPTYVCVAAEASPVGRKHEGGNWFCGLEGGVHCVAQEPKHDFVVMRGMAEGESIVAHREGVCVCPKDLVMAVCAEISWKSMVTLLQTAQPVVESHGDSERLWGLPSKPWLTRFS